MNTSESYNSALLEARIELHSIVGFDQDRNNCFDELALDGYENSGKLPTPPFVPTKSV